MGTTTPPAGTRTDRPPFITLTLQDPRIEHESAAWLQTVINQSPYCHPPVKVDGVYGPHTAQETKAFMYRAGHPNPSLAVTPSDMVVIWNTQNGERLPQEWRANRVRRMAAGFKKHWGITIRSWRGLHPTANPPNGANLNIITREQAGLRPPRSVTKANHPTTTPSVIHWEGPGHGAVGLEASLAQLRAFQAYHMDTHGWNDIGYNIAIPRGCDVGTVVELRGLGVRGAHCGNNTGNGYPGVLIMLGELDGEPTKDQLTTLQMWLREHARGRVTGHWEWSPTSCPGASLKAWIRDNRTP